MTPRAVLRGIPFDSVVMFIPRAIIDDVRD
jgi:hypothetical protein